MLQQPKILVAPDGEQMIIHDTRKRTNGTFMSLESFIPAHNNVPNKHYHPHQEEIMTVMDGKAGAIVDGVTSFYRIGEVLVIPEGCIHTIWAEGDKPLRAMFEFRPALNSEDYFSKSMQVKNVFQQGALLHHYTNEIRFIFPLSLMYRVLGWFGKMPMA